MQFELSSFKAVGSPFINKVRKVTMEPNEETGIDKPVVTFEEQYGVNVMIVTKIADQPHPGFTNTDVVFVELDKDDSITESENKIAYFADLFIAEKYPDTE